MARGLIVVVLAVFSLLSSGAAFAGVPCAGTSSAVAGGKGICAPDAAICPQGDYDVIDVTVTVKDCYGTPLMGLMVDVTALPFGGDLCICPGEASKTVGPTDANGVTHAYFSRFGGCANVEFSAICSGIELGPSNYILVLSPDHNADCWVELVDFGEFALSYFKVDACFDFNCDGIVELIDLGEFALHYLHECP
jgi:hypothetical protein